MKNILFLLIFLILTIPAFGQGQNDVTPSSVDMDLKGEDISNLTTFKNLKNANLNFENVDVDKFLSFKKWKLDTDEKELYPNWESIIRERANKELAGHFFQCVGTCRVDRAEAFFNPQHRSNVYEGDEIQTFEESYAWIFLIDGTMVRLAPNSSITINEINLGVKENFINARINYGNVYWLSRFENQYEEFNGKETDALFFPLKLYDAQPVVHEYSYTEKQLFNFLEEPQTTKNQYRRLNSLIEENNKFVKSKKTYAFIVMPTLTVMGYSPAVEFISLLGGRAFIKNKAQDDIGISGNYSPELTYQLRGYDNKSFEKLEVGTWYEIDEKGKKLREADDISFKVVGEFITRRIPSLLIARELFLTEYSKIMFYETYDRPTLAKNYGYRLWGKLSPEENKKEDLYLRLEFLKEYFRRVETTNLLTVERFRDRMKERGEVLKSMEYGPYFYKRALDRYYDYVENFEDDSMIESLNSTKKKLWKVMHGLK